MKTPIYAAPLLATFLAIQYRYRKPYSYPGLLKIQELMAKRHGIYRSTRTFIRWLNNLSKRGLINRSRRIRRDPKLGMVFQSTITMVTRSGYRFLAGIGVDCWKMVKKMFTGKKVVRARDDIPDIFPPSVEERITLEEMRAVWRTKKAGISPIPA